MCSFFSFVHDGRKIYYFDHEQRKNGVKMPDGNRVGSWDSHSSITCYYGLDDDAVNKFEYNPYTDKLKLDGKAVCTWDEEDIREQLDKIDWMPIAGDVAGVREFLRELRGIKWLKSDGTLESTDKIKVLETRAAAGAAARAAAWDAVLAAARAAAWDAAWAAATYVELMYVCDGPEIDPKHREHIQTRMDVWRHGYGVLCDVDGVLFCYERI